MSRWVHFSPALLLFLMSVTPALGKEDSCSKRFRLLSKIEQLQQSHPRLAKAFRIGNIAFLPLTEPLRIAGKAALKTPESRELRQFWRNLVEEANNPEIEKKIHLYALTVAGPYALVEVPILLGSGMVTATDLKSQLPAPEGPMVFVEAVDETANGYGSEEAIFKSRQADTPGSFFLRARNVAQIKEELKKIAQAHGPIQLLEVVAHGSPGKMIFPDGELTESNLGPRVDGVMAKNSVIRLVSCQVARNFHKNPVGENFLQALGNIFLDQGGKVIGSTRYVLDNDGAAAKPVGDHLIVVAESVGDALAAFAQLPLIGARVPFHTIRDFPKLIEWIRSENQPPFRIVEIPGKTGP